jgi:hypothetical protein
MRALFPSRRLYHCLGCDKILFIRTVPTERSAFADTAPELRLTQDQGAGPSRA